LTLTSNGEKKMDIENKKEEIELRIKAAFESF
jgi:hypothetical protein